MQAKRVQCVCYVMNLVYNQNYACHHLHGFLTAWPRPDSQLPRLVNSASVSGIQPHLHHWLVVWSDKLACEERLTGYHNIPENKTSSENQKLISHVFSNIECWLKCQTSRKRLNTIS